MSTTVDTAGMDKQQIIDEIVSTKAEVLKLINNVRSTKTACGKISSENQYLQDYVGSLMTTDVKK